MFLDLATGFFHLGVHWRENGGDITISNLDTINISSSAIGDNLDEVLDVLLLALLSDAVEDESWCLDLTLLVGLSILGNELQDLFSRFSHGDTAQLAPKVLSILYSLIINLSD
jgi:hypothetical protein